MSESRSPCRCCLGFILTAGLTSLYIWLSFRHIPPRYYLTAFSLLSSPPTGNLTALFHFEIQIENKNRQTGLDHDALDLSLAFNHAPLTGAEGPTLIPAFYQGHHKTALKAGNLTASAPGSRPPWAAAVKNGTAVFTVGLESAFRYKVLGRRSRHHAVNVSCDVAVEAAGAKTAEKGIRLLGSAAPAVVAGSLWRRSSVAVAFAMYVVTCCRDWCLLYG